jgi:hypothetical protein
LWTWLWLSVCEEKTDVLPLGGRVSRHPRESSPDGPLADLLHFQQEIMLSPEYDPKPGKTIACRYNWQDYFFKAAMLTPVETPLHPADTHMGPGHQYPLVPHDRQAFVTAAIGYSYPYSKFRHFFHQPDQMRERLAP